MNVLRSLLFYAGYFLAMLVCVPLIFVGIGILLMPLIAIFDVVMVIVAGIKAANGEHYRYPLTFRFLN